MIKLDIQYHTNIDFDNYDAVYIPNISRTNKMKNTKKGVYYSTVYGAFDTETSYKITGEKPTRALCWVNSWQFALVYDNNIYSYHGRDIRNFALFLEELLNREYNKRICVRIWVHNLSYDLEYIFQTLKQYYDVDVFVKKSHSYLNMKVKGKFVELEFLDSFALMPKSLAKLCKDYDVYHAKQEVYDYKKTIYSDTPLTRNEITYDMYDVYALCEIITGYMQSHPMFSTTDTIPYTATGEVRKLLEQKFKENETQNRYTMYDLQMTPEEYILNKQAYTGGITRVNTLYANQLVYVPNGEIVHADIKSSYPYAIMYGTYPTASGIVLDAPTEQIINNGLWVGTIILHNVIARHGFPNLSISKCECEGAICDNGKIIKADTIKTTITSVDYKIVLFCYQVESISFTDFIYYPKTGKIPKWISDTTMELFNQKENINKDTNKLDYGIKKAQLNSIYGCCSTALDMTEELLEDDINELTEEEYTLNDLEKAIKKQYQQKFVPYLADWITAYSRLTLYRGMACIPYDKRPCDKIIYCDTDSLFIRAENPKERDEIMQALKTLNESISKNGFTVPNYKGKVSTLGIFDFEDLGKYNKMVGIHAKAYALGKDTDEIQTMTLAGVTAINKRSGVTREQECGTFTRFMETDADGKGCKFVECGGVTCLHISDNPHLEIIDGHSQWVASGGIILDTVKQISFNENENFIATMVLKDSIYNKDDISQEMLNYDR